MTDEALEQQPGGAAADAGPDARTRPTPPATPARASAPRASRRCSDELARCHDRLLRKTAEFDNYRKRIERERREQADRTVGDLLLDLCSSSTTSSAR